jgi:hypothetical protein
LDFAVLQAICSFITQCWSVAASLLGNICARQKLAILSICPLDLTHSPEESFKIGSFFSQKPQKQVDLNRFRAGKTKSCPLRISRISNPAATSYKISIIAVADGNDILHLLLLIYQLIYMNSPHETITFADDRTPSKKIVSC